MSSRESYTSVINRKAAAKQQLMNVAMGRERADLVLKNALYVGYSTPNKKAKAMLPKEIQNDQSFYPSDETLDHLEVYQQLGKKLLGVYNDLYLQVKMYRK